MFKNFNLEISSIFKDAEEERDKLNHEYVGTEHLLLSILKTGKLSNILSKYNLDYESFYNKVNNLLLGSNHKVKINIYTPLLKKIINKSLKDDNISIKKILYYILDEKEGVAIRLLALMDINVDNLYNELKEEDIFLEDLAKYGKILNNEINLNEKVVGRDKEINLMIETLMRKKKCNPLLIGDAGVGKSAIVEEFTRMIVNKKVPKKLANKIIFELSLSSLIGGSKYRGDFEERLNNIIDIVLKNDNIILFVDEIHSLKELGSSEGAISAGEILKPYLARGKIKCIGATTKKEYEDSIKKDKALDRRFDKIIIKEPTKEETINILKEIKKEYTSYHKVYINDKVLENLVNLSELYFPNKKNPDKAIELLDSVMSFVKIKKCNNVIKDKEDNLNKLILEKEKYLENNDYKKALKIDIKIKDINKDIKLLENGHKIYVTNEDLIDELEFKNNIILTKDKIKIVKNNLKGYNQKDINLLIKSLTNSYHAKVLLFNGKYGNLIKDLSKELNYKLVYLNELKDINKIYEIVRYNPNTLMVVNEENNKIVSLINKIRKDGLVEYNDEYISFNNTIVIVLNNHQIGFNNTYVSNIPIDNIICFKESIYI